MSVVIAPAFLFLVVVIYALRKNYFSSRKENEAVSCKVATEAEKQAVRRYNDLYDEVPLHGGKDWRLLGIEDLTKVHTDVIETLASYHGVSRRRIANEMVNRAEELSAWMSHNQHRPFYAGSDMSDFIEKPKVVAEKLAQVFHE